MAKQTNAPFITRPAGQDLTGYYHRVVKLDSNGNVVPSAAGTDRHLGVLDSEDVQGMGVSVRVLNADGTGVVKAGGALNTLMTELTSDANGRAVAANTGDWVFGLLLSTASAQDDDVEYLSVHYKK